MKAPLNVIVIVATAVMGTGLLAACGSSTTVESTSPTNSASREAGAPWLKEIHIKVVNNTGQKLKTAHEDGAPGVPDWHPLANYSSLANGASVSYQSASPGVIVASSDESQPVFFVADNPDIGAPYVEFFDETDNGSVNGFSVGESYTWKSGISGRTYKIIRDEDSKFKEFTIRVSK